MYGDRVGVVVASAPGTGTISLGPAITNAVSGDWQTFTEAGIADGSTVSYTIVDGHSWETNHGVFSLSGQTLTRGTPDGSSSSGSLINASATATVFIAILAKDINQLASNSVSKIVPGAGIAVTPSGGTGQVVITSLAPLSGTGINVKSFGAIGNGIADDSTPILNATTAAGGSQKVFFPPGTYKFSISFNETLATTFYGDTKGGSICVPLGPTQPCFLMNQVSAQATFLQPSFRDLQFLDPGNQTSCGIWNSIGALDIDRCQFENLKYGVINNVGEWCRYRRSYFDFCQFGVYATSSNAANDPLGITSGYITRVGGSNPSEQYFNDNWFNFCTTAYYEDQPTNPFDHGSHVLFDSCQIMGGNAAVVSIGVSRGLITFNKCWFESRTGSEPGIVVHGKSIPSSIIYTEGASVTIREARSITTTNPIFVKFSSGLNSAIKLPPRLLLENTDFITSQTITVDEGVFSSVIGGFMDGIDLSLFSHVRDVIPFNPTGGASITFPAVVWPIAQVQGSVAGPFQNLWPGGSCAGTASATFGTVSSATITSGDGFIGNKYLKVLGAANNFGIHTNTITTVTNKIYFISFGIRQVSGSTQFFFVRGKGAGNGPGDAGFVSAKSGRWQFFCGITGCSTGGSDGDVRILNASGSTIDFDMSAIQVVQFDTIEQAMIYANSGVYMLPVIL